MIKINCCTVGQFWIHYVTSLKFPAKHTKFSHVNKYVST